MDTKEKDAPVQAPKHGTVPIFAELTKEDKDNAMEYTNNAHCILATALRRMGYSKLYLCTAYGLVDGHYFEFSGAGGDDLWDTENRRYFDKVVGKQIILYPRPMNPDMIGFVRLQR